MLEFKEQRLYHQIHPLKLMTDILAGIIHVFLFWNHKFWFGMAIGLIPSVIMSLLLMRYADLNPYKNSAFGRYVLKFMTRNMESIRFTGMIVMLIGSWFHEWWIVGIGLLMILFGWTRGLLV